MKRYLLTGIVGALALNAAAGAHAADSSRAEMTGAGTGAAIGGALAGPPGIVVGAAVGAVFGDRWHKKNESIETLNVALVNERGTVASLNEQVSGAQLRTTQLSQELSALDASGARELHRLLTRGLEIDLPFRTDETELPDGAGERIAGIAQLLSATPGLAVQIDGYADPRGSVDYNAALSLQRAETVRELLTQAGLDPSRIATYGHGESIVDAGTSVGNADQLALQRRVTVTFYRDEPAMLGATRVTGAGER